MKTPMNEVLAWLKEHHPALHQSAEIDRSWVWLTADLKGDQHKETRDAIKAAGFRFAVRGHPVPSGKTAFWAHHCTKPIAYRHPRKDKAGPTRQAPHQTHNQRPDPLAAQPPEPSLAELASVFA